MKIKKLLFLIITVGLLSTLGCKGDDKSKVKLVVLGFGDETTPDGQAFEVNITNFIKNNPGIEVQWDMLNEELYHNRMTAMLVSGEQLDVATTFNGGSHHTKVMDSGQAIDQRDFIDATKFQSGALTGGGKNGELWSIPTAKSVHTVFYSNDKLLSELGLKTATSYEELLEQKYIAQEKGKILIAYPAASSWCNDTFIYSILVGRFAGIDGTTDLYTGRSNFDSGASLKSLEFIKKIFDDGILNDKSLQSDYGASLNQFNNGNALYMIDGGWRAAAITLDSFSWNKFPSVPGQIVDESANGGFSSSGWAVMKSATLDPQRKKAAVKLLNYMVGEEASLVRAEIMGSVPAIKVKKKIKYKSGTEVQGAYIESLKAITTTIGDKLQADVKDVYANGIIEIGLGSKTPREVADDTQRAFNESNI